MSRFYRRCLVFVLPLMLCASNLMASAWLKAFYSVDSRIAAIGRIWDEAEQKRQKEQEELRRIATQVAEKALEEDQEDQAQIEERFCNIVASVLEE